MTVGVEINKHESIEPNYELWGSRGSTTIQNLNNQVIIESINNLINLNSYHLIYSYAVDEYFT